MTRFVTGMCEKGYQIIPIYKGPMVYSVTTLLVKAGPINYGGDSWFEYLGRRDTRYVMQVFLFNLCDNPM